MTNPKTCLITGGAGFIGSHLAELLLAEGHKVFVIDNLSTGRWDNIASLQQHPNFQFARASVAESVVLDRIASEAHIIFHLAAAVGVKLIVERPVHTIETNITGTEHVLKAAVRYRCRTIIASTSEVYGKGAKAPFAEDDDVLLGPTSRNRWAYAASKMVDEFLGLAYHSEYGIEAVCVRLFNTVGPRQTGEYGMVVPRFVQQALRGEPITVYGDGRQSRCFCDVRDVIRALVGLAAHEHSPGKVFNIGNTEEVTIRELAERVIRLANSSSKIEFVPFEKAYAPGFEDMSRRVPDITRINKLLGWRPTRSLDEILRSVIESYQ
jgi:UDP-glucose 4-epimerase